MESIRIQAIDYRSVFVDAHDDGNVWLSIHLIGGSANCVLKPEQARELIAALQKLVEQ